MRLRHPRRRHSRRAKFAGGKVKSFGGGEEVRGSISATSSGCPDKCSCKWKGGKEWVECANRELENLPHGAREETQVLDLSGNQLYRLVADAFYTLHLVNLQKLYIPRSKLHQIDSKAFVGLQGLVELDLSDNDLDKVPSESFSSIQNLMKLNLAGNPLRELRTKAFKELGQLSHLDLSKCDIEAIESGTFIGLHSLELLKLNDNQLRNVAAIESLPSPTMSGLHGLTLHNNPWLCDCELIELHNWLISSSQQIPQEFEPKCLQPTRLSTRTIKSLKIQELACAPELRLVDKIEVYEGDNTSLVCEVIAQPRANVVWLLNGLPLETSVNAGDRDNSAIENTAR
ncbi:hypothetical protein QAD02_019472 [Eretmocerus hayati]|uniref:Uncharacterized protein n=1 Tax=Eretmocerus hayati TaxID=131215 RepID=A0ACC2PJC1_9HYME|nr:hypothetical protein QAD02_019472 [Eretmocerus hayati]